MQTPLAPITIRHLNLFDCIVQNRFVHVVLSQTKALENVNITVFSVYS